MMTWTWGTSVFQHCDMLSAGNARVAVLPEKFASGATESTCNQPVMMLPTSQNRNTMISTAVSFLNDLSAYLIDALTIAASRLTDIVADMISPDFNQLKTI